MSPIDMFSVVTEFGIYVIGYISDGWTREIRCSARSPDEAMMITQNVIGDICCVVYVEKI